MAQLDFLVGAVQANTDRVLAAAVRARDEFGADAVVFPELALSGYPPEDLLFRPHFLDQVDAALERLQREISGITVIVGFPLREGSHLYNAAAVIADGALTACYRKQLLPNYGVFDEKRYFVPGGQPCVVELAGVAVGITICEDIWEPAPAMQAAAAGARLLVNINASPFHAGKHDAREQVVLQRARECALAILYVNLVGGQDELVFDGSSFVVDAGGTVTQHAPACAEDLYVVDLQVTQQVVPRPVGPVPHLAAEELIYRVLVLGIRDYVGKNGFPGAVLGLSGGIDSALVLALAVDALGAERVDAVMMPSPYTSAMSIEDAQAEAIALGVQYQEIPIERPFGSFMEVLAPAFDGRPADSTEENIQARCRGVILMALSNKTGRILLTTGNKSEMSVGYATLYGDMAGGFAPIKDVPKLLVYRLAQYRNSLAPVIPRRVLERPPSAELAPGQQDSDSLPPYPVLDPILERYIEREQGFEEIIAAGFEAGVVARVLAMVNRNEYKRRQTPPGIRITQRAFGRDRRYPITSGYQNFQNGG